MQSSSKILLASALTMALGGIDAAQAKESNKEKCFGVAKAGKNDCQAGGHSCQGQSSKDGGDEWLYMPKGLCEKIAGGSLTANAGDMGGTGTSSTTPQEGGEGGSKPEASLSLGTGTLVADASSSSGGSSGSSSSSSSSSSSMAPGSSDSEGSSGNAGQNIEQPQMSGGDSMGSAGSVSGTSADANSSSSSDNTQGSSFGSIGGGTGEASATGTTSGKNISGNSN